jgi:hypothetical protein
MFDDSLIFKKITSRNFDDFLHLANDNKTRGPGATSLTWVILAIREVEIFYVYGYAYLYDNTRTSKMKNKVEIFYV